MRVSNIYSIFTYVFTYINIKVFTYINIIMNIFFHIHNIIYIYEYIHI